MSLDVNPAREASEKLYRSTPVHRVEHAESQLTRLIEQQTAKVPSHLFLTAAIAAMGISFVLELTHREKAARFVGMWPGPLLTMGVYNKLVKSLGLR